MGQAYSGDGGRAFLPFRAFEALHSPRCSAYQQVLSAAHSPARGDFCYVGIPIFLSILSPRAASWWSVRPPRATYVRARRHHHTPHDTTTICKLHHHSFHSSRSFVFELNEYFKTHPNQYARRNVSQIILNDHEQEEGRIIR